MEHSTEWVSLIYLAMLSLGAAMASLADLEEEGKLKRGRSKAKTSINKELTRLWPIIKSPVPKWIFRTVLVWITDPWHFFKFMEYNSWQAAMAYCFVLMPKSPDGFWWWLVSFISIKTVWSLWKEITRRMRQGL
jgi:hypothetical protein